MIALLMLIELLNEMIEKRLIRKLVKECIDDFERALNAIENDINLD